MTAFGRFVLPEDVVIAPIAEMPDQIREGVEHNGGDCAVTRPRSRGNSIVLDAQSADLLKRFRTPATIVEAVIAYSTDTGLDPREALDEAFPVLSDLVAGGVLVGADSELAEPITTSLRPGERVGSLEVVEPVSLVVDTEVYLAKTAEGVAAIKIARAGSGRRLAAALRHEGAILERLDGQVSPRLLEAGMHAGRPFLALSWCAGVDALFAANEARRLAPAHARSALLDLASDVIAAFCALHAQGIAHGDVHPRNVLVEFDGTIRLIDFGCADAPAPVGTSSLGGRGGVDFFLEPESAAARLAGRPAPALSEVGEQYSVAALIYLLLTGQHTQAFSLEPEEMLRQLVESPALPFEHHDATGMTAVEVVVKRALCKDPADRHDSMAAFLDAFRDAAERDRLAATPPVSAPPAGTRALLDEVLQRLSAPDGELFAGEIPAPTASAMNGAAGFAYALLRIAGIREDESLLALADLWAVRARRAADSADGLWSAELEIEPETFGESSFYHHVAGVDCVLAMTAAARGDHWAMRGALEGFLAKLDEPCEHIDAAFGRTGLLLGASLLHEALPPNLDGADLLRAGETLRDSLWDELEREPPLMENPAVRSLGAAHGWAGYLFALLRWTEASGSSLPSGVHRRLEELGAIAEPAGRGLRWPYEAGMPMPHTGLEASWCNGAAGHVLLWTLAHGLLGDDRFDRWARMAGWTASESPTPSVGDLCCGLGGRAYALLGLYRHSREEIWLERARLLAGHAETSVRVEALRRDSLYKGEIGVALLAAELESPERSCMPLFERERRGVLSPHV